MTDLVFVDTNVLVYCRDASEGDKQPQAQAWMAHLWRHRIGRLSYQVLQEYYVTVTRKLRPGLNSNIARDDVRNLMAWQPLPNDGNVLEGAWFVQDRFGLSWWDALIVSSARAANCRYLLSEDLQTGQDIGGIEIISPFAQIPEALGLS